MPQVLTIEKSVSALSATPSPNPPALTTLDYTIDYGNPGTGGVTNAVIFRR